MDVMKKWWVIPELSFVSQFYNETFYLKGFEEKGNLHDFKEYDHILFSFHGLPERHVDKVYKDGLCKELKFGVGAVLDVFSSPSKVFCDPHI